MNLSEAVARYNSAQTKTSCEVFTHGSSFTAVFKGLLDTESSRNLITVLDAVADNVPPGGEIFVNLTEVSYISSAGVGALSTALTNAEKHFIDLVLLDVPDSVKRALTALGLISYFTIENSDEKNPTAQEGI